MPSEIQTTDLAGIRTTARAWRSEHQRHVQRLISCRDNGDYDDTFTVLSHDPTRHDPMRQLVIVIHPGDMIEDRAGWDADEWPNVRDFSRRNRDGTATELAHWRKLGFDIVVLHRGSCSQFGSERPWNAETLTKEIKQAWNRGSVLFGDELESAGRWIIDHLHIVERPHIYLAGAYSDPEHGCLTHVGRMIESVVGYEKMTVSDWSPPGSSPGPTWRGGR